MLTITDGGSLSRALKLPIDLRLKRLLMERRDQLRGDIVDIARFISVFIISRTEAPSRPGIHTELGMASRGDPSPLGPETAMSRPDRRNRAHLLQLPKKLAADAIAMGVTARACRRRSRRWSKTA